MLKDKHPFDGWMLLKSGPYLFRIGGFSCINFRSISVNGWMRINATGVDQKV